MVGPISEAERDAGNRRVKLALFALVTASPPLLALRFGPSPAELLAALGGGLALGLAVVWYLGRLAGEFTASRGRRRR